MPVFKQLFDRKREYRLCTVADIDPHFDKIKQWVPETEHVTFKIRMAISVNEDNAWCTENTFLYYTKQDLRIAHGIALFGNEYPTEILALFIGVFSLEDNDTHILRFKLHPGKFMQEYKSLLTMTSIRRTHADPDHPLYVHVDKFRQKVVGVLNRCGIRR